MKREFRDEMENPEQRRFAPPGITAARDTESVMAFYDLPRRFPRAVMEAAERISEPTEKDFKGRLDLRRKFIFTCDPVTARDYDDALSLETDRHGNRVLGVHIADVSHYVKEGGPIDREAYKRANSVYFADRVVPMLPECLCNGVCSLVPGKDRLAFSVFMTFDAKGKMIGRKFAKSVIRSKARYTYEQVMSAISGKIEKGMRAHLKTILAINALSQQLRNQRFSAGALDLEIPEAELKLDDEGELIGVELREYDESHQMIEECMVAANEAVAGELWPKGIRILARLHAQPDDDRILQLRAELRGLGVRMGDISKPKAFARFLREIKSNPLYPTIAVMILRSMKKAVYDAKSIGHFGLAKRFYAHFTSPIRRYPDLTLHRQLADYLVGVNPKRPPQTLAKWALHASECEETAAQAERDLQEIKKCRFLQSRIGSGDGAKFDAVISSCTPFGCFVWLPEIATTGLVHISQLANRYVSYSEVDGTLSAGGKHWRVGDKMRVAVVHVDIKHRKTDFIPCSRQR